VSIDVKIEKKVERSPVVSLSRPRNSQITRNQIMFANFFRWNQGKRSSKHRRTRLARRRRKQTQRALVLESLENRQLLTAVADVWDPPARDPSVPLIEVRDYSTHVIVYGTEHDDEVSIRADGDGRLEIEVKGPYETVRRSVVANVLERVTFFGQAGNDRFDGSVLNAPVRLHGGEGDDHLVGGSGDDFIDGGAGDDTLVGNAGNDRLIGGPLRPSGTPERNTLDGGSGDDVLNGGFGEDVLVGGSGNDRIYGDGEGGYFSDFYGKSDQIDAGSGDDFVDAGHGNDVVNGGPGNDEILGRNGDDRIDGGDGNDTIHGDGGRNYLQGGPGDDAIFGGNGVDELDGGSGRDRLDGGAGNNIIYGNDGDTLVVTGTERADDVVARQVDGRNYEVAMKYTNSSRVRQLDAFHREAVGRIEFHGNGGDDRFENQTDIPTTLHGELIDWLS
jgi:Ca2+-binding RTX toxin-like protein